MEAFIRGKGGDGSASGGRHAAHLTGARARSALDIWRAPRRPIGVNLSFVAVLVRACIVRGSRDFPFPGSIDKLQGAGAGLIVRPLPCDVNRPAGVIGDVPWLLEFCLKRPI